MRYFSILKENLKQSARHLNLGDDISFQQDYDRKHSAYNAKLWLMHSIKNQLNTPPQLQDLNLIEYLWDVLERKMWQHNIISKDMLKSATVMERNERLKRLSEVLKHKGYPTRH